MQGVTTALVAFLFVCMIFPSLVRNRPQYYAALFLVLLIVLFDAIAQTTNPASGFRVFAYLASGIFQVVSIFLLFLSVGGVTPRQLAADLKGAYEVIRRGEEQKTVVIPINKKRPAPDDADDTGRTVYVVDTPTPAASPAATTPPSDSPTRSPQSGQAGAGAIPLE